MLKVILRWVVSADSAAWMRYLSTHPQDARIISCYMTHAHSTWVSRSVTHGSVRHLKQKHTVAITKSATMPLYRPGLLPPLPSNWTELAGFSDMAYCISCTAKTACYVPTVSLSVYPKEPCIIYRLCRPRPENKRTPTYVVSPRLYISDFFANSKKEGERCCTVIWLLLVSL